LRYESAHFSDIGALLLEDPFTKIVELIDRRRIARVERPPLLGWAVEVAFMEEIAKTLDQAFLVPTDESMDEVRAQVSVAREQPENFNIALGERDRFSGSLTREAEAPLKGIERHRFEMGAAVERVNGTYNAA
jgi:hypothetical protein